MKKLLFIAPLLFVFFIFFSPHIHATEPNQYCVYDVKKNNHLTLMKDYIETHTNTSVTTFYNDEHLWVNIDKDSPLLDCDVLNMSLMTTFNYWYPTPKTYTEVVSFFEDSNNLIVTSAGNYKELEKQNIFTNSKNKNIYIVGQSEQIDKNTFVHHYAVGENIDFVVPNYHEDKGTSAASAFVSSIFIQALEKGVLKKDLDKLLVYSGFYKIENISYKVLDIEKTVKNIDFYINNETLFTSNIKHQYQVSYKKPSFYGKSIVVSSIIFLIFITTCSLILWIFLRFKKINKK